MPGMEKPLRQPFGILNHVHIDHLWKEQLRHRCFAFIGVDKIGI